MKCLLEKAGSDFFGCLDTHVQNLGGISLVPLGIVFGVEPKFMFGFGIYRVVTAGPYFKGRASVGVALGSILGAPLEVCRGVTWKIDGGFGLGATFLKGIAATTAELLKTKNPDGDIELLEHLYPIWTPPTSTMPDNALCRGD